MKPGLKRLPIIYALLDEHGPMSAQTLAYKAGFTGRGTIMALVREGVLEVAGRLPHDTEESWKRRKGVGVPIVRRAAR